MSVFDPVPRTILILEDDKMILRLLVEHARRVGRHIRSAGLPVDLTILSAQTLSQALQRIEEYERPIDIVSVDIELDNKGLSVQQMLDRNKPTGGFALLEKYKDAPQTIGLVYSGKNEGMYSKKSFQQYGVLNHIFKSENNAEVQFENTIETALWYLTAYDSISLPLEDLEIRDIQRAEEAWENTLAAAEKAGIYERDLPETLDIKIQEFRNSHIHPDTEMPVEAWTQAKLRRFIVSTPDWVEHEPPVIPELPQWTIIRCLLSGYGKLTNQFASQKQPLMHIFGHTLSNTLHDFHENLVFKGHIDRDFMQGDPFLIFILNTIDETLVATIKESSTNAFTQSSSTVLPGEQHQDFEAGNYPLELIFKIWTSDEDHDFSDLHAVIDELSRGDDD